MTDFSEAAAWRDVARIPRELQRNPARASVLATQLLALATQMGEQVRRGVHRNPLPRRGVSENPASLVTLMANPTRDAGALIASDVQWIIYRHAKDGKHYGHAFGGHEDFEISAKGGKIHLTGTAERTRVEARALPDGRVILQHTDGLPIWSEIN